MKRQNTLVRSLCQKASNSHECKPSIEFVKMCERDLLDWYFIKNCNNDIQIVFIKWNIEIIDFPNVIIWYLEAPTSKKKEH